VSAARRTRAGLALALTGALALSCENTDDGGGSGDAPDAVVPGSGVLTLALQFPCDEGFASVDPDADAPIRLSVRTVPAETSVVRGEDIRVRSEPAGLFTVTDDGQATLVGGAAEFDVRCAREGTGSLAVEGLTTGRSASAGPVDCIAAGEYARRCLPIPPDAAPVADAGVVDAAPMVDAELIVDAALEDPPLLEVELEDDGMPLVAFGDRAGVTVRFVDGDGEPLAESEIALTLEPAGRHQLAAPTVFTDAAGEAKTTLITAGDLEPVRVVAHHGDSGAEARSAPRALEAGPLRPSGLTLTCATPALAGFDADGLARPGVGLRCTARAADPDDRPLAGRTLGVLAEAGLVPETVRTDDDGTATFDYVTSAVPAVVADGPDPRNGVAVIVLHADGEEDFEDTDGDAVFDEGADRLGPGHDLAEPWVDADDDGDRDFETEAFYDADGDDDWDGPDGAHGRDVRIHRVFPIIWTGPHDPARSRVEFDCDPGECVRAPACGTPFGVRNGGAGYLEFTVADRNGNCVRPTPNPTWTAVWQGSAVNGGEVDAACFDADGNPGAQPQRVRLVRLDPAGSNDTVDIRFSYNYTSPVGATVYEQTVTLCVPDE
jgi:hypothetical protein